MNLKKTNIGVILGCMKTFSDAWGYFRFFKSVEDILKSGKSISLWEFLSLWWSDYGGYRRPRRILLTKNNLICRDIIYIQSILCKEVFNRTKKCSIEQSIHIFLEDFLMHPIYFLDTTQKFKNIFEFSKIHFRTHPIHTIHSFFIHTTILWINLFWKYISKKNPKIYLRKLKICLTNRMWHLFLHDLCIWLYL